MADAEEPVPKLPRGKGIKLSGPELLRIVITAGLLVAILVLAKPCGNAVSTFLQRFDNGSNASKEMPKPEKVQPPVQGVMLRGDMTDDERRKAIELERARAAAAGSGSN